MKCFWRRCKLDNFSKSPKRAPRGRQFNPIYSTTFGAFQILGRDRDLEQNYHLVLPISWSNRYNNNNNKFIDTTYYIHKWYGQDRKTDIYIHVCMSLRVRNVGTWLGS